MRSKKRKLTGIHLNSSSSSAIIPTTASLWKKLPIVLWKLSFEFLSLNEENMIFEISKWFFSSTIRLYIRAYGSESFFSQLLGENFYSQTIPEQLKLYSNARSIFSRYASLSDQSYIPLFYALSCSDQKSAIEFIQSKITKNAISDVADLVFLQNVDGQSAIILAQDHNFQDFLNFCFDELIVKNVVNPNSRIKTRGLDALIDSLQSTMSEEVLWVYGCAYVCGQEQVCSRISSQPFWNKTEIIKLYRNSCSFELSLTQVGVSLGSLSLCQYALEGISEDDSRNQLLQLGHIGLGTTYSDDKPFTVAPLTNVILNRNQQLFNLLLEPTKNAIEQAFSPEEREIILIRFLAFSLRSKNIYILNEFLNEEIIYSWGREWIFTDNVNIRAEYFDPSLEDEYNLLELALLLEWKPGIQKLFSMAVALIYNYEDENEGTDSCNDIISPVIDNNSQLILEKLFEHGLSFEKAYRFYQFSGAQYPLIASLGNGAFPDKIQMTNYIIENIGPAKALEQLEEKISRLMREDEEDIRIFLPLYKTVKEQITTWGKVFHCDDTENSLVTNPASFFPQVHTQQPLPAAPAEYSDPRFLF